MLGSQKGLEIGVSHPLWPWPSTVYRTECLKEDQLGSMHTALVSRCLRPLPRLLSSISIAKTYFHAFVLRGLGGQRLVEWRELCPIVKPGSSPYKLNHLASPLMFQFISVGIAPPAMPSFRRIRETKRGGKCGWKAL